uniref:Uncharacterized protein n=3 Tax=Quercus lobata TaxID=97700 RepID=A0A7N2LRH0_QUELO
MESTLFLRYNPLPSMPLRISSPLSATRLTNPNFSSNHYSLSLPNSSYQRPLRHAFSPVVCAINRFPEPSTNEEAGGDNKIVRGAVGVSLVLACVLGVISRGCTMSPKANAIASTLINQRSASSFKKLPIIYPAGGNVALQSLFDTTVYVSSRLAEPSKFRPWSTIKRPSAKDVKAIQREAMQLIKSGKGDQIVKEFREAYKAVQGDPEPEFNVEMALVEVLMCLGKYEEALKCNCLKSPNVPADGRVPLYKAIIYTMLDNKISAKYWWREYIRTVDGGIPN